MPASMPPIEEGPVAGGVAAVPAMPSTEAAGTVVEETGAALLAAHQQDGTAQQPPDTDSAAAAASHPRVLEGEHVTLEMITERQNELDAVLIEVDKKTRRAKEAEEDAKVAAEEAKAVKGSVDEVMKSFFRKYPNAPKHRAVNVN